MRTRKRTQDPPLVIVMGPSGAGKTVIGRLLAERLDVPFVDGEDYQPAENLEKIAQGIGLTGDERRPWLLGVASGLSAHEGRGVVIACSALRLIYRNLLRERAPDVFFVQLDAPRSVLTSRLMTRFDQRSPIPLLEEQLRTLEPLRVHENGTRVDSDQRIDRVVRAAHLAVKRRRTVV